MLWENKVKYRLLNICDVYKCMSSLKLFQLSCTFTNYTNKILENVELICLYIKYLYRIIGSFRTSGCYMKFSTMASLKAENFSYYFDNFYK